MNGRFPSYVLCAALWLGCVYELILIAIRALRGTVADTPIIGSILTQGSTTDRLAPIAILVIFAWVLVEILLRFWRMYKERQAVQEFEVAIRNPGGLSRIKSSTRAGRRAEVIRQRFGSKSLHDAISGMASLDANAVDSSYAFIRVYVWILPVVGFIGTACGMSHAIAGFGDALKGNLDVSTMTARLSQLVIPGLANAFATTILALFAAIITHFCATVIHTAEHSVLNDLDRTCVTLLAGMPVEKDPSSTDLSGVAESLREIAERLGENDVEDAAGELSAAATALQEAADEMKKTATAPFYITVSRRRPARSGPAEPSGEAP